MCLRRWVRIIRADEEAVKSHDRFRRAGRASRPPHL